MRWRRHREKLLCGLHCQRSYGTENFRLHDKLCRYPFLIIDDFGMERDTSYGLEQLYNVIDSRYRSRKPLIVTTNLTLQELQNPEDTAHSRIYDHVLEMCVPIHFSGESYRKEQAQARIEKFKERLQ